MKWNETKWIWFRYVVTYYCVLMALAVFYFFCSFQNPLPWTVCDPEWSTNATCYGAYDNITGMNLSGKVSSAEAFFVYGKFIYKPHFPLVFDNNCKNLQELCAEEKGQYWRWSWCSWLEIIAVPPTLLDSDFCFLI